MIVVSYRAGLVALTCSLEAFMLDAILSVEDFYGLSDGRFFLAYIVTIGNRYARFVTVGNASAHIPHFTTRITEDVTV